MLTKKTDRGRVCALGGPARDTQVVANEVTPQAQRRVAACERWVGRVSPWLPKGAMGGNTRAKPEGWAFKRHPNFSGEVARCALRRRDGPVYGTILLPGALVRAERPEATLPVAYREGPKETRRLPKRRVLDVVS